MTIEEVFEEYEDTPLEKKQSLAQKYAEDLRKAGMSEEEIEDQVSGWLYYDEKSELMNMYGADSEEELNDWLENNDLFSD